MNDDLTNQNQERPPFFGSWNKIYAIVFGELIILIVLFYFFTKVFS